MPRPTAAQLVYGSATVICTTLAMLLLSGTTAGIGIAVIGIAGLGLGLLVALTVPAPRRATAARTARTRRTTALTTPSTPPGQEVRVPVRRAHTGAEARISEHSLRR
jgi:hypothetical protein